MALAIKRAAPGYGQTVGVCGIGALLNWRTLQVGLPRTLRLDGFDSRVLVTARTNSAALEMEGVNWLRTIFQGKPKVEPTPQRQPSEPRLRPPTPPLPQPKEDFRQVDPARCKGAPPAKAFCRESPLEFDLEWNDKELRIRYLDEVLRSESFHGNGHPRTTSLQRVAEGDSIPAGALRSMVLGVTRLRLEADGAVYFCKLCMTQSAGHGTVETWVSLMLDTQAKTARYESFSEFDDCR